MNEGRGGGGAGAAESGDAWGVYYLMDLAGEGTDHTTV